MTKTLVEERLDAMRSLVRPEESDLTKPPTYTIPGIQEGAEIQSFASKDAEKRLPAEAVLIYIPKADKPIAVNVAKYIAQATSADDKLWDSLIHYAEVNKDRVRFVAMKREQATAEILRISQAKGTAVYDETGVKLPGMYSIETGIVFTPRPAGEQPKNIEEEEQILEAETKIGELVEQSDLALLPASVVSEEPVDNSGIENLIVILRGNENNVVLPQTETLEKKRLAVNITPVLEGASKIIAFIYEEDVDSRQVINAQPLPQMEGVKVAPAANSGNSGPASFYQAVNVSFDPNFDQKDQNN